MCQSFQRKSVKKQVSKCPPKNVKNRCVKVSTMRRRGGWQLNQLEPAHCDQANSSPVSEGEGSSPIRGGGFLTSNNVIEFRAGCLCPDISPTVDWALQIKHILYNITYGCRQFSPVCFPVIHIHRPTRLLQQLAR